jgi:hypothetical protein
MVPVMKLIAYMFSFNVQVDISTMLEEAVHYVKFLQLQIKVIAHVSVKLDC